MIYDKISNINLYKSLNKDIYNGLKILSELDKTNVNVGTVDVNENIRYHINEFETSFNDKDFEAHKQNIDIFYILSGCENIKITSYDKCTITKEYNEEVDAQMFKGEETCSVNLYEGMFLICFPDDIHKPGMSVSENCKIKKIVMKIKFIEE